MPDFIDAIHSVLDKLGVPKDGDEGGNPLLAVRIEKETREWVNGRIDDLMAQVAMVYDFKKNPMVRDLIKGQLTKFAEDCYARGAQTAARLAMLEDG